MAEDQNEQAPSSPTTPEASPEPAREEAQPNKTATTSTDTASASRTRSEADLLKAIQDPGVSHIVNEVLRSQQIASIYIDARSGGAFFSGEAHIDGDVISGGQVRKTRLGRTGTGAIYAGVEELHSLHREQGNTDLFAGRILPEMLDKIKKVYVPSTAYQRAQQLLQERHLLIIWGQAHRGKWTSALHLLTVSHQNAIFELDPTTAFTQLRSATLASECGYVLDTMALENAEQLNAFTLNRLSERLREQKSRLIITVDKRISLSAMAVGNYLVPWDDTPNQAELLRQHLAWYVEDATLLEKAQLLSQEAMVQQLLSVPLRPSDIDRLAELIAQAVLADRPLSEVLARYEKRTQEQVAEWFEHHSELRERTLMIAVAVFNGATEQVVIQTQVQLQDLIQPPKPQEVAPTDAIFGPTRSQRLQEVFARVVDGYELTEFGRSPVKQVVLNNPTLQPAILHYIWEEYDRLRPLLLAWLRDLGLHVSFEVRARAAAAVGELSKFDFGYVRQEVLLPWANSEEQRGRQSAALALGVPAWEGTLAPQVLGLLHHWSTLRNNPRLCWTAAVAYGGLVGLRFPDIALRDLQQIAQHGHGALFAVASRSILTLFLAGELAADYFLQVLALLATWVNRGRDEWRDFTGILVFLMVSRQAALKVGEAGEQWPAMLWLTQDPPSREKITQLWRQALNLRSTRQAALDGLLHWCKRVDEHEHLYPSFFSLIADLTSQGSPRERERLLAYLARWRNHPQHASATAGRVLSDL